MPDNLVRERSFDDVLKERQAEAQRLFGNTLDTGNPRTPENLLVRMMAATGFSHDRIVNRAIKALLLSEATGNFLDARGIEYDVKRKTASFAKGDVIC